ncbi:MAG: hypothetical protein IJR69_05050 [Bacteroidaceae bacterium]|nr:hypothetical protein [Bacteroidaceae bacterium]
MPVVVVLHDEALVDERQVEVARDDTLARGFDDGDAGVQRVQLHGTALVAGGVGDGDLLVLGNLAYCECAFAATGIGAAYAELLKVGCIADADVRRCLGAQRPEVYCFLGGQRYAVLLAVDGEAQFRGRHFGVNVIRAGCQSR